MYEISSIIKLSNDTRIHFALKKEIGKISILKKHAETLRSILNHSNFTAARLSTRVFLTNVLNHFQLAPSSRKVSLQALFK